ncbi:hypothetical protein EON81_09265 [bacterium]|nr:MAG: hypothetical protein EON81_09265 [bacterium]
MPIDLDSAARSFLDEPTPLPRMLPTRRGARPLRWAAPMAAGIAVFVLWPRTGSSAAWAQVAEKSRSEPRVAVRTKVLGRLFSERYRDGNREAIDFYDRKGRIDYRLRTDGKQRMEYLGRAKTAWLYPAQESVGHRSLAFLETNGDGLQALLASEGVSEIARSQPEGKLVRYHLKWSLVARPGRTFERRFDAFVEPESDRIRRIDHIVVGKVTMSEEIDYPASIPSERFAISAPPGTKLRDAQRVMDDVNGNVRKGLATRKVAGKTITLRGLVSSHGSLVILWTGSDLPSDGRFPATLVGATSLRPGYGIAALSSRPQKDPAYRPVVYAGLPVRGQEFFTPKGIASSYNVRIPVVKNGKSIGEATFKKVIPEEIPSIYSLGSALVSKKLAEKP